MIFLLDALCKLGKLYINKENLDEFDVLVDEKNIKDVILVEFIENGDSISFNKIFYEEYDNINNVKYLYKKGSSRGTNITPSSLITDLKKTFNNKFSKWFKNNKDKNELFKSLNELIIGKKEDIYAELKEIYDSIYVKDTNILLSFVITKDDKYYYLNDFEEFKDAFIEGSIEKFKGSEKIIGESVCYLCNENKNVYGSVSSGVGFAFSTSEKKGNIPMFNQKNQLKLIPICYDCALNLNAGKKFVERFLDFSEFGLRYYVIPNFLFDSKKGFNRLYSQIQLLEQDEHLDSKDLVDIEYSLSKIVNRLDDVAEIKFLFYQASNSAFDILAYVESVIPSYLNQIYKYQSKISNMDFFSEKNIKLIFGDNQEGNFIKLINKNEEHYPCALDNWYKRFLRDFINNFSKKIYIDTVVDIISNQKIDYNFLMSRIMGKIRSNWRNDENYALKISVLKSLMLLILLNDLNLIKGDDIMTSEDEFSIELILNSPEKRATFLLGALTRKLMYKQYRELGSSPFYNKLWGLSLDDKKIKKLYPMVINKLREYDIAYINIEEEISLNLAKSENNWKLNRDETSYYFVLGFTLPNFDKNEKEDDKNE